MKHNHRFLCTITTKAYHSARFARWRMRKVIFCNAPHAPPIPPTLEHCDYGYLAGVMVSRSSCQTRQIAPHLGARDPVRVAPIPCHRAHPAPHLDGVHVSTDPGPLSAPAPGPCGGPAHPPIPCPGPMAPLWWGCGGWPHHRGRRGHVWSLCLHPLVSHRVHSQSLL